MILPIRLVSPESSALRGEQPYARAVRVRSRASSMRLPRVPADGVPRWEIDLLAVRSTARGMGIGRALIEAAVSLAPAEAQLARALVRMDNTAAERTFTTAGFAASEARVTLYTATPQALQPQVSAVYAIQVETLTYSGLWLERAITGETLRAARNTAAEQSLDVVGVLTPACDITEEDCHEAGFTQVAEYRWWQRGLEHRLGERGRDVIAAADDDGRDAR